MHSPVVVKRRGGLGRLGGLNGGNGGGGCDGAGGGLFGAVAGYAGGDASSQSLKPASTYMLSLVHEMSSEGVRV